MISFAALNSLFSTLLEATISASILVLLVLAIQLTVGRRLSPAWRYLLWMPVLVRLLVPVFPESSLSVFNAVRWGGGVEERAAEIAQPIEFALADAAAETALGFDVPKPFSEPMAAGSAAATAERKISFWLLAVTVWFVVASLLLLRLGLGSIWLTLRLRRDGRAAPDGLEQILTESAKELGSRIRPRLRETSMVESPALFGLFRPVLLVPPEFSRRLDQGEMRHVFLHELAHLKRGDWLVNWLMAVAQALHWFNPLAWVAFRQMRIERELACDEIALRAASSDDPSAYGRTILRLLDGVSARHRLPALVGIAEEKHSAKRRLRQIARFQPGHRRYRLALPILLAVAVAGLTNGQTQNQEPIEPTNNDGAQIEAQRTVNSRAAEEEPLHTRTYKLDPDFFTQALKGVVAGFGASGEEAWKGISDFPVLVDAEDPPKLQEAIELFFKAVGIDFSTNSLSLAERGTSPPQKAIFFNDRTGVLFVRTTSRDLEIIEGALQALSITKMQSVEGNRLRLEGLKALEREYQLQKKAVEQAQERVDQLRKELRITDPAELAPGVTPEALAQLRASEARPNQKLSREQALLRRLQSMERSELRSVLPTVLQPPDELLNRYLADLGKAEQELASLAHDISDEHPNSRRLSQLIQKVHQQIEGRIDGILAGLEVRAETAAQEFSEPSPKIDGVQSEAISSREAMAPFLAAKRDLENSQRILDTIFMRILAEKVDASVFNPGTSGTERSPE